MIVSRKSLSLIFGYFFVFISGTIAQDLLPKLNQYNSIQKDSNKFYLNEIWISSADVNNDDAYGYTKRAVEKIQLGYYKEAVKDIYKSISLDSVIAYNFSILGYCMMKLDSLDFAIDCFNKAISKNDTSAINYFYLGDTYLKMRKLDEADSLYNKALTIDRTQVEAIFGLGNVSFLKGQFKRAEVLYNDVIKLNPKYTMAYYNLAIMYLFYDPGKTMKYLNKTIKINPNYAPAYYLRGYINTYQSNYATIIKDWNKAIELDSANGFYHLSRGLLKLRERKFIEGINEIIDVSIKIQYKNIYNDFEKSTSAQRVSDFYSQIVSFINYSYLLSANEKEKIKRALGLFYVKEHEEVDEVYEKLLEESFSNGLIFYFKGFNLEYLGRLEDANESYQKAISLRLFPFETYIRKGKVLKDLKKFQESVNTLNIFINRYDSINLAYRCRGISYVQLGKLDSAITDFNHFLKTDSTETDIYFNRANCYKSLEIFDKAISDYEIVIKMNKYDMESIYLLSECKFLIGDTLGAYNLLNQTFDSLQWLSIEAHLLRGAINIWYAKYDAAISDFDQILKFDKKHINALINRASAFYQKKEYFKALQDYSTVVNTEQQNITALYGRGLVYVKMDDKYNAYKDLKAALDLGHPFAQKAIYKYLKGYKP